RSVSEGSSHPSLTLWAGVGRWCLGLVQGSLVRGNLVLQPEKERFHAGEEEVILHYYRPLLCPRSRAAGRGLRPSQGLQTHPGGTGEGLRTRRPAGTGGSGPRVQDADYPALVS